MPVNNPSPYALYSREQLEKEAMRNQKIIVALFLCLGKAMTKLTLPQRTIECTETEIRQAWKEQKSPIRILSEVRDNYTVGFDPDTQEQINGMNERVYKVLLQNLDLKKVGFMNNNQECPPYEASTTPGNAINPHEQVQRRVFDLQ